MIRRLGSTTLDWARHMQAHKWRWALAALTAVAIVLVVGFWDDGIDDLLDGGFSAVAHSNLNSLLAGYGYWAVLLLVGMESMGIPVPGESALLLASVYAGTTHRLNIGLVIVAATIGAIAGDNAGYGIGRRVGYPLLQRWGRYVRLDSRRLLVGQYLFWRHGDKVVFFGRFVALLRIWAAMLAGAHRMPWQRFLVFNAAGGFAWALLYGTTGYVFGHSVDAFGGTVRIAFVAAALLITAGVALFLRRNEHRLYAEAERAQP